MTNTVQALCADGRRVIAALEEQALTEAQLVEALDLKPSALRGHVQDLAGRDLVYVYAYVRQGADKQLTAVYAAGSKVRPSAKRRRPKNTERLGMMAR